MCALRSKSPGRRDETVRRMRIHRPAPEQWQLSVTHRRWKAPRPGSASWRRAWRAYRRSSLARRYGSTTCDRAFILNMS